MKRLAVVVPAVRYEDLRSTESAEPSAAIREQVVAARNRQLDRFAPHHLLEAIQYRTPDRTLKHDLAASIIAGLWESRSGVLSTQVLQEFYVNVTRNNMKLDFRGSSRGCGRQLSGLARRTQ
jgi:hypothetical protein